MLKLSESRKNKMSLGIQVADKTMILMALMIKYLQHEKRIAIYNINATCKR